tara:strand:- start:450 stop:647 length:198 start_codon:yes stop_codon:yes gene_type:complete
MANETKEQATSIADKAIADLREETIRQMVAMVREDKEGRALKRMAQEVEAGELPLYVLLRVIKEI